MSRVLDGQVAIVTGAARGIGAAIATALTGAGARVVIGDVLDEQSVTLAERLGAMAHAVHLDVRDAVHWQHAVERALEMGRLTILVNNAAIQSLSALEHETAERFEQMLSVNVVGTFLGTQAVIEPMRRAGGGSIVNVSSTAGLIGYPRHAAYGASKWAVRGLTKVSAIELGAEGIRVNSIHPGPIRTSMLGNSEQERFERVPLRRCGEPEEVASLALFLASPDSAYISGAEFTVDGGSVAGAPSATPF